MFRCAYCGNVYDDNRLVKVTMDGQTFCKHIHYVMWVVNQGSDEDKKKLFEEQKKS